MMRLIRFLLGLSIGAAAGVLLAPKSGRELRQQLFSGGLLDGAAERLLPPDTERAATPASAVSAAFEQPTTPALESDAVTAVAVEEPPAPDFPPAAQPIVVEPDSMQAADVPPAPSPVPVAGVPLQPPPSAPVETVVEAPATAFRAAEALPVDDTPFVAPPPIAEPWEPAEPPALGEAEPPAEAASAGESVLPEPAETPPVATAEPAPAAEPDAWAPSHPASEATGEEPAPAETTLEARDPAAPDPWTSVVEPEDHQRPVSPPSLAAEPSMWAPIIIPSEPRSAAESDAWAPSPAPESPVIEAPDEATTELEAPAPGSWSHQDATVPVVEPETAEAVPLSAPEEPAVWTPAAPDTAPEAPGEIEAPAPEPVSAPADLLSKIEETRAALAADLAAPFGSSVSQPPTEPEAPAPLVEAESRADVAATQLETGPGPAAVADNAAATPEAEEPAPLAQVADESPFSAAESQIPAPPQTTDPAAPSTTAPDGGIDQAEMRRRIEETRARLKAKAFDAMMSGESALLRHGSGSTPLPSGHDAPIEPEIDSTIDRSLTQEDF